MHNRIIILFVIFFSFFNTKLKASESQEIYNETNKILHNNTILHDYLKLNQKNENQYWFINNEIRNNNAISYSYFKLNLNQENENQCKIMSNEIKKYISEIGKEEQINVLSNYISKKYGISEKKAKDIVKTSFSESENQNIDPILILSIIGIESKFNPNAKSRFGAIGLTQVIPKYHQSKISKLKNENLNLWSIKGNIKVGIQIIKEYIYLSEEDIQKALQRYNGSIFDPNKTYSKKVLHKMKSFLNVINTQNNET